MGKGVAVDVDGNQTPIEAGDFIYVPDNEVHHFENAGSPSFESSVPSFPGAENHKTRIV